jgi:hypothetical protein
MISWKILRYIKSEQKNIMATAPKSLNVQVAVRVRPFNNREKGLQSKKICEVGEDGRMITLVDLHASDNDPLKQRNFTFDHVYDWDSTQEQVYAELGIPIVEKALSGYNGTIFAYGQTGSGKTWSMLGDGPGGSQPGIIPRMNEEVFRKITEMQEGHPELQFLCLVSFLEIYNEVVKDLLNPSDKELKIREHPDMGVYVEDLAEIVVKSAADVNRLLDQGQKVRHVAATNMNERSSRSHSCFTLKVEQRTVERTGNKEKTTTITARVNLVDLAGSERADKTGATGDTLKQGAAINKSLSALGNVINALAESKGKSHIPYRDSKLTRLLQHSLGGNSLTVMIAAISPADDNFDESLSTLQYANRAKSIKNEAKKNMGVAEQMIMQLRNEIEELRKALAAAQAGQGKQEEGGGGGGGGLGKDTAHLEELISNLERAKAQSWEEKQKLSELYEAERANNLANERKIQSVMQTMKEEYIEGMNRIKELVVRKNLLKLAIQRHIAGNPGADTETIEQSQELARVEEELLNARAEVVAQRSLVEEDANLRKMIIEEEKQKMRDQSKAVIDAQIAVEREKLVETSKRERADLLAKYSSANASGREQELELELIDANSKIREMMLDLAHLKHEHKEALQSLESENKRKIHEIRVEELQMFKELTTAMEEERDKNDVRVSEYKKLLAMAGKDIEYLRDKCDRLERQLLLAAAFEEPAF